MSPAVKGVANSGTFKFVGEVRKGADVVFVAMSKDNAGKALLLVPR